jgi:hypothetical protein
MAYETIELQLDKKLIHQLYGLAIAWDMTVDEVIESILKQYIKEENMTLTECYYPECPYHLKDEPFGVCTEEQAREMCLKKESMFKRTVYISGPMEGYENHNFPAFMRAEKEFDPKLWNVINPARISEQLWQKHGKENCSREFHLREDIRRLPDADTIYMLKGWGHSRGAKLEKYIAEELGMLVLYEEDE